MVRKAVFEGKLLLQVYWCGELWQAVLPVEKVAGTGQEARKWGRSKERRLM